MNTSQHFTWILDKIDKNIEKFGLNYPSACTTEHRYRIKDNDDWTNGFYIGMILIAYEYSMDEKYLNYAKALTEGMIKRIDTRYIVDHHDIGFLVLPSITALYRITGEQKYFDYSVVAADILCERYHADAKFIQAWGDMDDDDEYRLIVDSLINLPLLFWAYRQTKNEKYRIVYTNHFNSVITNGVRSDFTSYHTYYFNRNTKLPVFGKQQQGFAEDSCWARGQGWVLMGTMLYNQNEGSDLAVTTFKGCSEYVKAKTREDKIPYWDYAFDKTSNQYHDSSAAAINALAHIYAEGISSKYALDITNQLLDDYTSEDHCRNEGLLTKGLYAYRHHKGIGESNLWGDYYFMELLYKYHTNGDWKSYFEL